MDNKVLSERHKHAASYSRKKDLSGGKWIGARGLYYRTYRCLRVYAQSGLPVHEEWQTEAAYKVLFTRGLFTSAPITHIKSA